MDLKTLSGIAELMETYHLSHVETQINGEKIVLDRAAPADGTPSASTAPTPAVVMVPGFGGWPGAIPGIPGAPGMPASPAGAGFDPASAAAATAATAATAGSPAGAAAGAPVPGAATGEVTPQGSACSLEAASAVHTPDPAGQQPSDLTDIEAPMVGVFYMAPAPGAEPFVKLGSKVKKGETLCIVEAMKCMNEVVAEEDGTVVDICATDGELVEYGRVLMRLS